MREVDRHSRMLRPSEIARRLDISLDSAYGLIARRPEEGGIPAARIGRQLRVRESDLATWLEHQIGGRE